MTVRDRRYSLHVGHPEPRRPFCHSELTLGISDYFGFCSGALRASMNSSAHYRPETQKR